MAGDPKGAWAHVDAWKNAQSSLFLERRLVLIRLGWWLVASEEDGQLCARRIQKDDPEWGPRDETPELKAWTFDVLVAAVKAENGKGVAHG